MVSIGLVVGVALWAVCAVRRVRHGASGIAALFDACAALPMAALGDGVGVFGGVLMALRAVGDAGLPAAPIVDGVLSVLSGCAPVQVF